MSSAIQAKHSTVRVRISAPPLPKVSTGERSPALVYFPIVWEMTVPRHHHYTLYEVSIVCSVSAEDRPGRTWLGSPLMVGPAQCKASSSGSRSQTGPGLPGMGIDGSQEVRYREGQVWAAPVLALKLGLEMLPAGSAAVRSGLGSFLQPACGDVQRPLGKA